MRLEDFRDEEEGLLRGSLGENNGNTDAFRCSLMVNCGVVLVDLVESGVKPNSN